jgi:mono/diheme cytochrome c family protein
MTMNSRNIQYCLASAMTVLAAVAAQSAQAQSSTTATAVQPTFSVGPKFQQTTGEAIYRSLCQGCHMPQGEGAKGAGTYPSLARNKKLEAGGYAVYLVVNGQRGMPPFGEMMTDGQVAEVVNYVRTHFGNNFTDAVTAADVKQVRR